MSLTPLELPGWLEFNTWRTSLEARRISFESTPGGPKIRAVLYLDRRGRVKLPPNNPYLPVAFESARQGLGRRTADWLRVAAPLVEEMRRQGIDQWISLPPDVEDVRPWSWRGFHVGVRYSYYLDFPFDPQVLDRQANRYRDSITKLGMTVARVTDVDPVIECLAESETRQEFSNRIGRRELQMAQDLLGEDSLRMYVCFDAEGRAASSSVVVHAPGAYAISLMSGVRSNHLADGAGSLVKRFAFEDLALAGATGVDFCGANIESVAAFKSHWGARLVPYFVVRTYSVWAGARFLADWRQSRQGPRTG